MTLFSVAWCFAAAALLLQLSSCTSTAAVDTDAAALATLAAEVAATRQMLVGMHTAMHELQARQVNMQVANAALKASHDDLRNDHASLRDIAGMLEGSEGLQRRSLSSTDNMCEDHDDARLVVDGTAVFVGDAIVGTGDGQSSVVDAVANAASSAAELGALHDWMCLSRGRGALAKLYQDVSTMSAPSAKPFEMGNTTYLAVANNYNGSTRHVKSAVFMFNEATAMFELFQEIDTTGAYGMEHFQIGDKDFLAVANQQVGTSPFVNSSVFRYNTATAAFELLQDVPTMGARDWKHFRIGGLDFLVVANMHSDTAYKVKSVVYLYDDGTETFEAFQEINTSGAFDWEHISIGDADFLAVANNRNGSSYLEKSAVYRFNNVSSEFELFQQIDSAGATDFEHFSVGNTDFLALANFRDADTTSVASVLYRYNGTAQKFEFFQEFATHGAMDFEHFRIGDVDFLAVANHYKDESFNVKSVVYRYDESAEMFRSFREVETVAARDWQHFRIGDSHFLSIAQYAWTAEIGQTSVILCNSFCFV